MMFASAFFAEFGWQPTLGLVQVPSKVGDFFPGFSRQEVRQQVSGKQRKVKDKLEF